jgi:cytochrome c-type biogenesis protein CcmH/NrfF
MQQYSLTIGAHLLLWVFPVALVVLVILENYLDARNLGPKR